MSGKNYYDGGEAVLQAFRALDVDYVMSSPGSEWGSVWEAFARQSVSNTPGPTFMSCAHETLAVNLAMGYSLYTQRMQAVMLHTGVGLLQGSMGIDNANRQNVPMLIVSGESLTYGDQEGFNPGGQWQAALSVVGSPHRLAEPITKWATQASSVHTVYNQMVSAGEMSQRTPAGPTFLTVPIETQLAEWSGAGDLRTAPRAPALAPNAGDIDIVADLLLKAERPLIVTGSVGRQPAARAALIDLAETLAVPVGESHWADFANIPGDHPSYQGPATRELLDEADLVLIVRAKVPWYPVNKRPLKAKHIIVVDEVPFNLSMTYHNAPAEHFLEGDVATALELLAAAVSARIDEAGDVSGRRTYWSGQHDKYVAAQTAVVDAAQSGPTISPALACNALSRVCPDDTIFVDETITYKGDTLRHLQYDAPQSYFRSAGGLGQGIGMALGVKMAAKDRPVVAILGDGTFMYNPLIQCLAFSKTEQMPILIVVMNNGGYDAMRKEHHTYYPDGVAAANDLFVGFPVTSFEYQDIVAPFDGYGRKVENPADLDEAIAEAMAAVADGKVAILNIMTDTAGGPSGG